MDNTRRTKKPKGCLKIGFFILLGVIIVAAVLLFVVWRIGDNLVYYAESLEECEEGFVFAEEDLLCVVDYQCDSYQGCLSGPESRTFQSLDDYFTAKNEFLEDNRDILDESHYRTQEDFALVASYEGIVPGGR